MFESSGRRSLYFWTAQGAAFCLQPSWACHGTAHGPGFTHQLHCVQRAASYLPTPLHHVLAYTACAERRPALRIVAPLEVSRSSKAIWSAHPPLANARLQVCHTETRRFWGIHRCIVSSKPWQPKQKSPACPQDAHRETSHVRPPARLSPDLFQAPFP